MQISPDSAFAKTNLIKQKTKAVFLYKLFKFVSWPSSIQNDGNPLQLCVYGAELLKNDLTYIQNKSTNKQLSIRSTSQLSRLEDCQVLYLGSIDGPVLKFLETDDSHSILTISDVPNSFNKGVMVSIFFKSSKLRLNINRTQIYKLGVELKPKIFRLSDKIR